MDVGDYVRIKDGTYTCIGKIKRFKQTSCLHIIIDYSNNEDFNESGWFEWNVIKSSPNIIDLIEVGDYVNGCKVDDIRPTHLYCNQDDEDDFCEIIFQDNIKSIVTHEQFSQMEYKLGE